MKKLFVFLFLLTVLCLIVSCGDSLESNDTTVANDTTTVPHTTLPTTETHITSQKQEMTAPATTTTVETTVPETTEDDGIYRGGFSFSGHYEIPYQSIAVLIGYEIQEACYYQEKSVPITLYIGIPSTLIDGADMPEDSVFTISLYNDANEEVCSLLDITLTEIKEKNYLCTFEGNKVVYAQSAGITVDLDLSLFDETGGRYLLKAKHSTETEENWDVVFGVYLRYSKTLAQDYYLFGK